jgi:DMSO/TMAO reductase YedYZ molybdopterin-dependent catalytic subunit
VDGSSVGFFDRNRKRLAELGIDPDRLPPGQYRTERFPVLHVGDVPRYDLDRWTLTVDGLVREPFTLSYAELTALPPTEVTVDIHCVTKWSRFDMKWTGVRVRDLLARAGLDARASHVVARAEHGYTTNLPIEAVLPDESLVAWAVDGEPLEPRHGFPARLVVPHLYFWKSAKWLRGIEVLDHDRKGFWERNGYHNDADPWKEQRTSRWF